MSEDRVVVVGAGAAGLSAALAAAEQRVPVSILEKSARQECSGDTRLSGGVLRFVHAGSGPLSDALAVSSLPAEVGGYPAEAFVEDIVRLAGGEELNVSLIHRLVEATADLPAWLAEHAVPLAWNRGVEGESAGLGANLPRSSAIMKVDGGGEVLAEQLLARVEQDPWIELHYETPLEGLVLENGSVRGVVATHDGSSHEFRGSVVLASGGFQASEDLRTTHFGEEWRSVKLLGSPHNDGVPMVAALDAGAGRSGAWGKSHVTPVSVLAPVHGDPHYLDAFVRFSYIYSILVNRDGRRFLDEGSDHYRSTYTKVGRTILRQPGQIAYQVFDAESRLLADPRYSASEAIVADDLATLATRCGIPPEEFVHTVTEYNAAARAGVFDAFTNDGHATLGGLVPRKSNWALPVASPPFAVFPVTAAMVFTFGGLRVNERLELLSDTGEPITGAYAAGEIVGGIYAEQFVGGSGLAFALTMGRLAGASAARCVQA